MEHSIKIPNSLRKRNFLFVLPLLCFPFITLLFWALGGGQARARYPGDQFGLNPSLPQALLEERMTMGKLGYYQQAAQDSAQWLELQKKDPYSPGQVQTGLPSPGHTPSSPVFMEGRVPEPQTQHAQVYRKLQQLETALGAMPAPAVPLQEGPPGPAVADAQLDRLEQLMRSAQGRDGTDTEMQQVNSMLDKILDIQHPARVREKSLPTIQEQGGAGYLPVFTDPGAPMSLLKVDGQGGSTDSVALSGKGFYGWETLSTRKQASNALAAVVQETQALVTGSTVKLRLEEDVSFNGTLIPRGSFVYGTATLENDRLRVKVSSIRRGGSLVTVNLSVYDLDGLEGIYIPGAITREVVRQSADRAVQGLGLPSLDPSPEVQVARAGMEAAKSLISKKTKLVRATVKAGYRVLLLDSRHT